VERGPISNRSPALGAHVFDQVMNWLYILTGSFALITFVAIVIFVLASRKQGSRKRRSSE
jgi:hypothetical protein